MSAFRSWGNYPQFEQKGVLLRSRADPLPALVPVLPYGNGRSYGDCCLLKDGTVVGTRKLDNFIAFDRETGVLRCESGVLLSEILALCVPAGWFLPVTPGTSQVTVGGAIANDVHGKNHHARGTFGGHLSCFELLRSDGSRTLCSADSNPALFAATIGGLGLTGLVTWAQLQLVRVDGPGMAFEHIRFGDLDEFFELSSESDRDYEYTVSWVDCAGGGTLGRGIFSRANHCFGEQEAVPHGPSFPFTPPISLVNRFTVKAFNSLYYRKQFAKRVRGSAHYAPFLYPLDSLQHWNRVYGTRGFLQYQLVIPNHNSRDALRDIMAVVGASGMASTLAVLKVCGDIASPGLMSFPLPGVSLALDFPNRGERTRALFASMDRILAAAGGRLYPAKDAHMSGELFRQFYPQWQRLEAQRDPAITSSLWQRVTLS